MPVHVPTVEQLLEIAGSFGMTLNSEDASSFRNLMAGSIASYNRLDQLPEPKLPVQYPRTSGYRPSAKENSWNAWYWKTDIKGATQGILAGKKVAIKDNICVAAVPMMNGSRVLEGYVPELDATVVTRILDHGGTIAGKAACEDLCFSAGSHTCATGPIRNPHDSERSTGGSSGGSAALVAAGDVEMALGGDQGGSIRTPSCWCGVCGMKPTWGLVPMTGGMPISRVNVILNSWRVPHEATPRRNSTPAAPSWVRSLALPRSALLSAQQKNEASQFGFEDDLLSQVHSKLHLSPQVPATALARTEALHPGISSAENLPVLPEGARGHSPLGFVSLAAPPRQRNGPCFASLLRAAL